ncbi:acetyltransferase [Myxococcus sp. K38C18041901]|uniref:esterase/lipase family protein n=1 Tax=Myxococcus guangdongensis TaxID=2906760 RepID=UPI0020A80A76|nr:acetyltransferase [Myxococcus guangdongensis]MCP3062483.1 acetyltransferase [Myxococcus guangdongensis]
MSVIRSVGLWACVGFAASPYTAWAQWAPRAQRTLHPVVFAHGLAGFDDLAGFEYWGDELGNFVGDACDELLELGCNVFLDPGQKAFATQVQPFESSEARGEALANEIESVLATTGARRVNIVGHSQGGMDARKAARVLSLRKGRRVVEVMVSIASPHRGSPVAKAVLDTSPTVTQVANLLATLYGNGVYEQGNDPVAAMKQLVYEDHDPLDGVTTGARAFNDNNPLDSRYASHYASVLTAQHGLNLSPAFQTLQLLVNIDGDGYCLHDCDNDGAAGKGDGVRVERDDDGVVGINSQQMGHRLRYTVSPFGLDTLARDVSIAPVSNINLPGEPQMTSLNSVLDQDHLDVVGFGPDLFNEAEFYAALIDYISKNETPAVGVAPHSQDSE